jgi:uncharacterized protein (TIGR02996 family)
MSCPECGSMGMSMDEDHLGGETLHSRTCGSCGTREERLTSAEDFDVWLDRWSERRAHSTITSRPSRAREDATIERQFLDEIYDAAAKSDSEANCGTREVYADWLIQRDDPLGTFIALQCARTGIGNQSPTLQERNLLESNWAQWIGPPSEIVAPYCVEFQNGFWSACPVIDTGTLSAIHSKQRLRRICDSESWGTVRHLGLGSSWDFSELAMPLLCGPVHRSLRSLDLDDD